MKIRVLVVDDSSFMRKRLTEIINAAPGLEVIGAASDAESAMRMVCELKPDVMTLDVNMPKVSGLEFLERLMRERPMRVIMASAFTREGSEETLRALELGAIDFVAKPGIGLVERLDEYGRELAEKIRVVSQARLIRQAAASRPLQAQKPATQESAKEGGAVKAVQGNTVKGRYLPLGPGDPIIFLGASTGGTEAIKKFLMGMPEDCPPILIVQHMPETFTPSFAASLNTLCRPTVLESQGEEIVTHGTVYIAPGHSHMRVRREGGKLLTELAKTEPVNNHRPSVDVLFDAAAALIASRSLGLTLGVILTGMGKDGAQGLLKMRRAGAKTFGQDEASCVVYGMPKEAFLIGAVGEVAGIGQMAERVLTALGRYAK